MTKLTTLKRNKRALGFLLLTKISVLVLALALGSLTWAADLKTSFSVKEGDASVTLKQLAQQAGQQVIFPTSDVKGVKTPAIEGSYSLKEALDFVLSNTGLEAKFDTNSGIFAVSKAVLPKVYGTASVTQGSRPKSSETETKLVKMESVEVTGTRLRGLLAGATSQPIVTITAEEIDRTGAQSIGDLLRYIPQVSSFTTGQANTQDLRNALVNVSTGATTYTAGAAQISGTAGVVTATVRGAPAGATLLLIDGKRAPKNNQAKSGDGFDLNGIPLAAVERIEVLLDGASSIYGADAMGGVINVITKKNYTGTEVRIGYENTFDTDVGVRTASVSEGFYAGKFRGIVTASWEKSNEMMLRDRSFTASFDRRPYGGSDYRNSNIPGGAGRVSRSGTVALPGLSVTNVAIPAGTSGVNLSVADYNNAGPIADPFDLGKYGQFAASYDRFSTLANFNYTLNDLVEFYSSIRASRNHNYQLNTPIQASNLSIPVGYPGNPFGIAVTLNKTFSDLIPKRTALDETQAYAFGVMGHLPKDWRYDASISLSDSHILSNGDAGTSIASALFTAAVAAGQTLNLFYDGTSVHNPNAPGVIESLTTPSVDEEKDQTWNYSIQFDGSIYELPAGKIMSALGFERREEYAKFPLRLATDTTSALPGHNFVNAYFAELNIPLVGGAVRLPMIDQLSLSGSYRHENYGNGVISKNPRTGIAWKPASWLLVRGSYGQGFKVPTLQQRGAPVTVTNSNTSAVASNLDPLRGNTVNPIYPITRGGKIDLRPEKSDNKTAGIVIEIPQVKGLSVSVDWFENTYKDRIATLLFNQMALLYPSRITRGANLSSDPAGWAGVVTAADLRPINVGYSQTRGFDIGVKYSKRLVIGEIQTSFSGTNYNRNVFIPTPGSLPSPTVNTDSLPVQINGNAFFSRNAWGVGVLSTYRAKNRLSTDRIFTGSAIRWDAQFNYDFTKSVWLKNYDSRFVKYLLGDSKLSLTVYNVFNKVPPFDDLFMPDNTVLDSRLSRYAISLRRSF